MDKEVNLPDNFHKSYFRIRFSDTPFLFYVKNFDIKKVLSVHPEWNFLAAQPPESEELEFLVDIKEKTIKQVGISNSAKGTIEINSINGDTKNLISELKKNLDIQNSFYKFSSEGIYRMEFEKPIPVSLPVKKQI